MLDNEQTADVMRSNVRRGRLIKLTAIAIILALAGAYRWKQMDTFPLGTLGEAKRSPNGRFEATVKDMHDESFLGRTRRWYEFEIVGGGWRQHFLTDPIPGPDFRSRSSDPIIVWADDSSSVRFVFPDVELQMKPKGR